MKLLRALLLVLVLTGCGTASPTEPETGGSPPAAPQPVAVVYRGPAACEGCAESAAALVRQSPLRFQVSFIGPAEDRPLTADGLSGVSLYVQPGGDGSVDDAVAALGLPAAEALREYVATGGRYLGFCMGAYLAGSDPGLGLLEPGDTRQYSQTPGALVTGPEEAVIELLWEGSASYHYVQDPAVILPSGVSGERVLSTFTNGTANALVRPYHDGWVAVVGSHPEAERDWYTDGLWKQDLDGLDHAQGLELIDAVMTD